MILPLLGAGRAAPGAGGGPGGGTPPLDALSNITAAWSADRFMLTSYSSSKYTDDGGGVISAFLDQSGAARNLTGTTTQRPTLVTAGPNSRSALDFNGTANVMTSAVNTNLFITTTAGYVAVVVIVNSIGTNDAASYANDGVISETDGYFSISLRDITGAPDRVISFVWDGGGEKAAVSDTIILGQVHVIEWRQQSSVLYIRVDGTGEQSVAVGTRGGGGFLQMGKAYGGSAQFADITVFEAFTANVPPSLAERDAYVANALAHFRD